MRANEIATQFERLPLAAQRLVAELIEQLGRPAGAYSTWEDLIAAGQPTEAILLPPVDTDAVPSSWPANRFMESSRFNAWADHPDITDSTEFVRQLRRDQWGMNRASFLIDSDVIIDSMRADVVAAKELERLLRHGRLGSSLITRLELVVGCRDKQALRQTGNVLKGYEWLPLNEGIKQSRISKQVGSGPTALGGPTGCRLLQGPFAQPVGPPRAVGPDRAKGTFTFARLLSDIADGLITKFYLSHGLKIPDAIICATALYHGLPLLTKNQRDFRFIPGLQLLPYPAA